MRHIIFSLGLIVTVMIASSVSLPIGDVGVTDPLVKGTTWELFNEKPEQPGYVSGLASAYPVETFPDGSWAGDIEGGAATYVVAGN